MARELYLNKAVIKIRGTPKFSFRLVAETSGWAGPEQVGGACRGGSWRVLSHASRIEYKPRLTGAWKEPVFPSPGGERSGQDGP